TGDSNGLCWTCDFICTSNWSNVIGMDYVTLFLEIPIYLYFPVSHFNYCDCSFCIEECDGVNISKTRHSIDYFIVYWFWWIVIRLFQRWKLWMGERTNVCCAYRRNHFLTRIYFPSITNEASNARI